MLNAINLKKSFKGRKVVRKVTISINQGEIVGLLGPNGAGKTTCFYMILGLIRADSGQVKLNNRSLTNLTIDKRAEFGLSYLPQDSSIFKKLSVEQNLLAILQTRSDLSNRERKLKLEHLLDEFNLTHLRRNHGVLVSLVEKEGAQRSQELWRPTLNLYYWMSHSLASTPSQSVI